MTLPPVQRAVYEYVRERCRQDAESVGVTEIAEHFRVSKPSAYESLRALERKGKIVGVPMVNGSQHRYAVAGDVHSTLFEAVGILKRLGFPSIAEDVQFAAETHRGRAPRKARA